MNEPSNSRCLTSQDCLMGIHWGTERDGVQNARVLYCSPPCRQRSEEQIGDGLRIRKETSNTPLHQNCVLPRENDKVVGEL